MKTIQCLMLLGAMALTAGASDDWRKVAFIGDASAFKISGLVEVISPQARILHEGEKASVGETLRIWRGAELILRMESSKSLVRAKGPVLLRLAPEKEGFNRASITGQEDRSGFVVRAVWGRGKFLNGGKWQDLRAGMTLPNDAKVQPSRDSVLAFYHPLTKKALRVTDHKRISSLRDLLEELPNATVLAAKNP